MNSVKYMIQDTAKQNSKLKKKGIYKHSYIQNVKAESFYTIYYLCSLMAIWETK